MVCGHSAPREECRSPLACKCCTCTQGHGTRPAHALSPRLMIEKEDRSVMPTCPTMGILTPRKVTVRHQLVVPSSSRKNDLSLVKHGTRVDLNPSGVKIHYTQESALVLDLPPSSPPHYIVLSPNPD
jgi:hypothetical protein